MYESEIQTSVKPKKPAKVPWNLSIHTVLIILYTLVSCITIRAFTAHSGPFSLRELPQQSEGPESIVSDNNKIERKLYMILDNNPFAGRPDPDIDTAWHGLLEDIHIRVTKTELDKSQQTSVLLPEGGGYLSWLGAYHELHCLVSHIAQGFHRSSWLMLDPKSQKIIRQWTYRDHYHPNLTSEEIGRHEMHSGAPYVP